MAIELEDSFAQWRDKINAIIDGSGSSYTVVADGATIVPDSRNTIDLRTEDISVTIDSGLLTDGDSMSFVAVGRGSGFSGVINLDGVPFKGSIVESEINVDVYETFSSWCISMPLMDLR